MLTLDRSLPRAGVESTRTCVKCATAMACATTSPEGRSRFSMCQGETTATALVRYIRVGEGRFPMSSTGRVSRPGAYANDHVLKLFLLSCEEK